MNKALKIFLLLSIPISMIAQTDINLENKFRLAQSYEQAGQFEKAEDIYRELSARQPWNSRYYEALNKVFLSQKKFDQSILLLKDRILKYPQDLNGYGLLGSTYYQMGNWEKADSVWDKALEINPANSIAYRIIANYAIQERDFDKAIHILKEAENKFQNPNLYTFDIAYLLSIQMKYNEAAEAYCKLIMNQPQNLESVKTRIAQYINRAKAIEETIIAVENFSADFNDPGITELLIFLYLQKKDFQKAYSLTVQLDNETVKNGSKIFDFAQTSYRECAYQFAVKSYDLLLSDYPNSAFIPLARLGYARSLEAFLDEKNFNEESLWKRYVKFKKVSPEEYLKIIGVYLSLADDSKSAAVVTEAYYRIGYIYFHRLSDLQNAEKYFSETINEHPGSEFAASCRLELAKIYIIQNKIDLAYDQIKKTIESPRSAKAEKNLARYSAGKISFWKHDFGKAAAELSFFQGELADDAANDAIELLMLITIFKSDSVNLALYADADKLAERHKFSEAADIFKALGENTNLFILSDIANFKYAEILISGNEYLPAVDILKKIAFSEKINIFSDEAMFLLANTYFYGVKDFKKSKEIFESLLEKFPNSLHLDKCREMIIKLKETETGVM